MTTEEVWELVLANEPLLRREAMRSLPKDRRHEFDELYSDVVYGRAHSIMQTYDPAVLVKPITHLCCAVRWYAFKWVNKANLREHREDPSSLDGRDARMNGHTPQYTEDHQRDARIVVEAILDRIPEDMATLLRWHVVLGLSIREIADHCGVPFRQVRLEVEEALDLARDYAGVDDAQA